jgi:hypothetical protein
LKELKTRASNEKGLKKTTLQCDQVLERLKATNGHATRNVLRKHQNLIMCLPILKTPSCSWFELITFTSYPSPSLDSTQFRSDDEKSMTKSKILQSQSKSMAIVASRFPTTSQI